MGAILTMANVSGAATLSPSCGYIFNPTTGTPPGFDAMTDSLFGILGLLGISGLPTDWHVADLETPTVGGDIEGDGIPDYIQASMIGALLCSGDTGLLATLNANGTQYTTFVNAMTPVVNSLGGTPTFVAQVTNVVSELNTWGTAHTPVLTADELALAGKLDSLGDDMASIASGWGMVGPILLGYTNWFGILAGLDSSEMNTVDDLIGELVGLLTDNISNLTNYAATCNLLAAHAQINVPPSTLSADLTALATRMTTLATAMGSIAAPTWAVFGANKFAAASDANGDGVSNLVVWNACKGLKDGRAQYVFYSTTPGLTFIGFPVAGLFGLLLMGGACALTGARSLRKK